MLKYDFNPIITVTNYYKLSKNEIISGFNSIFQKNNFDMNESNLQIIPWHDKSNNQQCEISSAKNLDCEYGRILTTSGVYTCPFLANDYRGRCGSSFTDYNKKCSLETSFCNTCAKAEGILFGVDYSKFA